MAVRQDTKIAMFILTYQVPWLKVLVIIDLITEMAIMSLPIVGFHSSTLGMSGKTVVMMAFLTRLPYVSPTSV